MEFKPQHKAKEIFVIFGLFVLATSLFVFVIRFGTYNVGGERTDVQFGVTFSTLQAESLGLDWRRVYLDMLDDLGVRLVRIPIYWNDVEREEKEFTFDHYHWMFSEAEARDVLVIPVLGMRVPRWPECHIPQWVRSTFAASANHQASADPLALLLPDDGGGNVQSLKTDARISDSVETTPAAIHPAQDEYNRYLQSRILRLVEREIEEFTGYSNILYWQIENEPLLDTFGLCPFTDRLFTSQEFELVRSMDPTRPLMGTESGEMSSWIEMSKISDVLGSSLYRTTFNPLFGFYYYPIPPFYYQKKSEYVSHLVNRVIISELQAEPWVDGPFPQFDPSYLQDRFSLNQLKENVSFARKTKLDVVLLWGVEWWAYMRAHGIPEYWDYTRTLFQSSF